MGLIQRVIEAAGISTISVSLAKDITKKILPPRAVFPGFPLGHPIGFPGNENQQLRMFNVAQLYLAESGAGLNTETRFDMVLVDRQGGTEILENALAMGW